MQMGFVKLLLDTRGFCFYSKLVLGPPKWIILMGKANKSWNCKLQLLMELLMQ